MKIPSLISKPEMCGLLKISDRIKLGKIYKNQFEINELRLKNNLMLDLIWFELTCFLNSNLADSILKSNPSVDHSASKILPCFTCLYEGQISRVDKAIQLEFLQD